MADMNRRNVLLGLGTAAAGSGIVFGSGAFTQIEAERAVEIEIQADNEATNEVTLTAEADNVEVDGTSGLLSIGNDAEFPQAEEIDFGEFGAESGMDPAAFTIELADADLQEDDTVTVTGDGDPDGANGILVSVSDASGDFTEDGEEEGSAGDEVTLTVGTGPDGSEEVDVAVRIDNTDDSDGENVSGNITIEVDKTPSGAPAE